MRPANGEQLDETSSLVSEESEMTVSMDEVELENISINKSASRTQVERNEPEVTSHFENQSDVSKATPSNGANAFGCATNLTGLMQANVQSSNVPVYMRYLGDPGQSTTVAFPSTSGTQVTALSSASRMQVIANQNVPPLDSILVYFDINNVQRFFEEGQEENSKFQLLNGNLKFSVKYWVRTSLRGNKSLEISLSCDIGDFVANVRVNASLLNQQVGKNKRRQTNFSFDRMNRECQLQSLIGYGELQKSPFLKNNTLKLKFACKLMHLAKRSEQ